jgi:hypothetical protein
MRLVSLPRLAIAVPRVPFVAKLAWAALGIFLFVATLTPPNYIGGANPEEGWSQLLTYLTRTGARAGVDFIYPYGPLYYLVLSPYEPTLFWQKIVLELIGKAAATLFLLRLARRMSPTLGAMWLAGLALIQLVFSLHVELFLLAGIASLIAPLLRGRVTIFDILAAAIFLAAISLAKFTAFPLAIFGLAVLAIVTARQRPRWSAILPFGSFGVALAAFFALVGQRIGDLPAFLSSSLAYSAAYAEGLALEGPTLEVRLALLTVAILVATSFTAGRAGVLARLPVLAILAFTAMLSWKLGFVRHDAHALGAFALLLFLPALLHVTLQAAPRPELRRGLLMLATLLGGIGFVEVLIHEKMLTTTLNSPLLARWPERARLMLHLGGQQAWLEEQRRELAAKHDLPRIRAAVGRETIDAYTECQGVALLNELNLVPRPTLQSVNAIHADWLRRNAEILRCENAPRFLLVQWFSFDARYPTLNDGPALLAMLEHYDLRLEEKGYLLFERRSAPRMLSREIVLERSAAIDEVIELPPSWPGEYRSLEVKVHFTSSGKLRTLAYRPPVLFFLVRDEADEWHPYRLVAPMARAEFLLDPLCENNADLRRLWETRTGRRVTAIRLHLMRGEASLVEPVYSLQIRSYR